MRVAIIDTYYEQFTDSHYAERPGLAEVTYAEQHASLMVRRFGTSDAYSTNLRALGHEAQDFVVNVWPLQRRWASENDAGATVGGSLAGATGRFARYRHQRSIALRQIEAFAPDVVYVQDLGFFSRRQLDRLRATGALVAGQIASPPPDADRLAGYDLILTSFPHFVERFQALGVASAYLPIAFDTRIAEAVAATEPAHDLVFVGGIDPVRHAAGTGMLERLCRRLPIAVWGYGVQRLEPGSPLRDCWQGEAWGLDMYRVLAGSRICLNRHIDAAEGFANNMRLFEATGVGTALCTEAAPNLSDLFAPGREVVAYEDEDDLVTQAERLLTHEDDRSAVARAGRDRTLRDHTYARRMEELVEILARHR